MPNTERSSSLALHELVSVDRNFNLEHPLRKNMLGLSEHTMNGVEVEVTGQDINLVVRSIDVAHVDIYRCRY